MNNILVNDAKENYNDNLWLSENHTDLQAIIRSALRDETLIPDVVYVVLLVYPYVIRDGLDQKLWTQILQETFKVERVGLPSLEDIETLTLDRQIRTALRRARKKVMPRQMLEVYVNLFLSQVYKKSLHFDTQVVLASKDLARIVNNQKAYGKLNQALAVAYNHWFKPALAIDHARLAYSYYFRKNKRNDAGKAAHSIAISYRMLNQTDDALEWIETAGNLLVGAPVTRHYGCVPCERGLIHYIRGEYEEAEQWLQIAIEEAQQIEASDITMTARESLALTLMQVDRLAEAETILHEVLNYHLKNTSPYDAMRVYENLGHCLSAQGNKADAQAMVQKGIDLYHQIDRTEHDKVFLDKLEALKADIK